MYSRLASMISVTFTFVAFFTSLFVRVMVYCRSGLPWLINVLEASFIMVKDVGFFIVVFIPADALRPSLLDISTVLFNGIPS
ncbi:Uncharacterised protein [uncultured archaeon]|nr:Uncharacterised protein [uncultured archaeon]